MDLIQAILLAILQGITEWLPLSSSAHLGLAQIFLKAQTPILFDLLLHVGTVISAIVYFRKDLADILISVLRFSQKDENFKLAFLIVIASIPTAIIGFAFHDLFASMFFSLFWIGLTLILNGAFMLISDKRPVGKSISPFAAILIGIAQGISISPGISRSGATIGTSLLLGIKRETAVRFSFILSIPAIIGATLFEWMGNSIEGIGLELAIIAIVISGIVGYLSIAFLIDYVKRKGLGAFAYYCIFLGTAILAISLF